MPHQQIEEELKLLNPYIPKEQLMKDHNQRKWKYTFFIIIAGIALAVGSGFLQEMTQTTKKNVLVRNQYGQGSVVYEKYFEIPNENIKEKIEIEIHELEYSQEELEQLFQTIEKEIPDLILGQNTSLNEVRADLDLGNFYSHKGIEISWETNQPNLIDYQGQIQTSSISPEGKKVQLTCLLTYKEREYDFHLPITLLPKESSKEESLKQSVMEEIKKEEEAGRSQTEVVLPEQINDVSVNWVEEPKNTVQIIVLALLAAMLFFWNFDEKIHKAIVKREEELLMQYHELVEKIVLLVGAGMNLRSAMIKIGQDYQKKKQENGGVFQYAYEEVLIWNLELESGTSESRAYEKFGKRCRVIKYQRLAGLLQQNLKKGTKGLLQVLQQEVDEASEERKTIAKRLGEEAGTKLLGPMLLMLIVVLIIMLLPAFLSFQI